MNDIDIWYVIIFKENIVIITMIIDLRSCVLTTYKLSTNNSKHHCKTCHYKCQLSQYYTIIASYDYC